MIKTTFPAGKYYVGDLCYVFNNETWQKICDAAFDKDGNPHEFTMCINGFKLAEGCTKYGDGEYNGLSVDSGSIGIVSVNAVEKDASMLKVLGQVLEFSEEFVVTIKDGFFNFGGFRVRT